MVDLGDAETGRCGLVEADVFEARLLCWVERDEGEAGERVRVAELERGRGGVFGS
jgi:hypothetical protein